MACWSHGLWLRDMSADGSCFEGNLRWPRSPDSWPCCIHHHCSITNWPLCPVENGQVKRYHSPCSRDPAWLCTLACPSTAASQAGPCPLLSSTWLAHLPPPWVLAHDRSLLLPPGTLSNSLPPRHCGQHSPERMGASSHSRGKDICSSCAGSISEQRRQGTELGDPTLVKAGMRPWVQTPAPRKKTKTKKATNLLKVNASSSVLEKLGLVASSLSQIRWREQGGAERRRRREIAEVCLKILMKPCLKMKN